MNINRIAVVSIPVADQQAAKAFYRDMLGFSVVRDNPMGPVQRWVRWRPRAPRHRSRWSPGFQTCSRAA